MKKNLVFSVATLLAGLVLASCGSGSTSSAAASSAASTAASSAAASSTAASSVFTPLPTPETYNNCNAQIIVWAPAEEEAVIKDVVDTYNAKQTVETSKFNYKFVAVSEADGGTTLGTDPTVAGYPSLVAAADDQVNNLVTKKIVSPLQGSFLNRVMTNDSSFSVDCVTNDGKVYGYPITADNGYFLWYDSSAFTGVDMTSLEDILANCKKLGKTFDWELNNGWYANSPFMSPTACGKNSLTWKSTVGTDGTSTIAYTTNWDNADGVATATAMGTLVKKYYDDGTWVAGNDADLLKGFTDKTMIAGVRGTWNEKSLSGVCTTLAATDLPSITVGTKKEHLGSFSGSKLYVVNAFATAAEQKAATFLGDLLTNKASQLVRFQKRASIPCNKELLASKDYTDHATIGGVALAKQAEYASIQSHCAEGRYWDVGKAIGQAFLDGDLGKDTAGTAYTWQTFLTAKMDTLRKAS
jgi:arabinogalactan oligomer/maltooligosaccharide transport system substrate-binding protein